VKSRAYLDLSTTPPSVCNETCESVSDLNASGSDINVVKKDAQSVTSDDNYFAICVLNASVTE
jgi:hypothetical protein